MSNQEIDRKRRPSKKVLTYASAALGGIGIGSCISVAEIAVIKKIQSNPHQNKALVNEKIAPFSHPEPNSYQLEVADPTYVSQLFAHYLKDKSSLKARKNVVSLSLRYISSVNGTGSATQIDRSGIYLTARHVVMDGAGLTGNLASDQMVVNNPYTGKATEVAEILASKSSDAAIVFAPTGDKLGAIPHMAFDLSKPKDNQEFTMNSLYYPGKQVNHYIINGKVNTGHAFEPIASPDGRGFKVTADSQLAVDGLIPFGGTSGSPIMNATGAIAGIESGAYTQHDTDSNDIANYAGARIVPLYAVQDSIFQPPFYVAQSIG